MEVLSLIYMCVFVFLYLLFSYIKGATIALQCFRYWMGMSNKV